MSILICLKIATLLKADVLHKLHTEGKKEKKKERGKERGRPDLSLGITLELRMLIENSQVEVNPIKLVPSFLLRGKIKGKLF